MIERIDNRDIDDWARKAVEVMNREKPSSYRSDEALEFMQNVGRFGFGNIQLGLSVEKFRNWLDRLEPKELIILIDSEVAKDVVRSAIGKYVECVRREASISSEVRERLVSYSERLGEIGGVFSNSVIEKMVEILMVDVPLSTRLTFFERLRLPCQIQLLARIIATGTGRTFSDKDEELLVGFVEGCAFDRGLGVPEHLQLVTVVCDMIGRFHGSLRIQRLTKALPYTAVVAAAVNSLPINVLEITDILKSLPDSVWCEDWHSRINLSKICHYVVWSLRHGRKIHLELSWKLLLSLDRISVSDYKDAVSENNAYICLVEAAIDLRKNTDPVPNGRDWRSIVAGILTTVAPTE